MSKADMLREYNDSYKIFSLKEKENGRIPYEGELQFVFGHGNADGILMLVGEAPGKDEVIQGKPFVGKAGSILNHFLEGSGLVREDIYITNTVKYRLARKGKRPGQLANRPATSREIENGGSWLVKEQDIINPKIVVTLGNVPLKAYGVTTKTIGDCHGQVIRLNSQTILFPMYHPASLIYRRELEPVYEADLKKLHDLIK